MTNRQPTTLSDRLDEDFAPAWRPQPGDKLVGEIVGISERTGQFEAYPIITVRQDDGTERAWHAFHTVAASELAKQRPKVGERIGVKYTGQRAGQGGTSYHAYKVQVDRGEVAGIDWTKYGDEAPVLVDAAPKSDVPSTGFEAAPAAKSEADDVDIPF